MPRDKDDKYDARITKLENVVNTHLTESGAIQTMLKTLGESVEKIESHQWTVVMAALGCAGTLVVTLFAGLILAFVKFRA